MGKKFTLIALYTLLSLVYAEVGFSTSTEIFIELDKFNFQNWMSVSVYSLILYYDEPKDLVSFRAI